MIKTFAFAEAAGGPAIMERAAIGHRPQLLPKTEAPDEKQNDLQGGTIFLGCGDFFVRLRCE